MQFDVYKNPNPKTNARIPYLLDVQNDLLASLKSRVVVPLELGTKPIKHLNPIFTIEGREVIMSTAQMAGVACSGLGEKVTNLATHKAEIVEAIDFLVLGF